MAIDRDEALAALYAELRRAASRMLRRDAQTLTMQPTDLVHEAVARIMRLERMEWNDQRHFFATAARIMRQTMIDAVRRRRRSKRSAPTVLLDENEGTAVDLDALDAALTELERVNAELATIVELRFFVGLSIEACARMLSLSEATLKRRWRTARAWLAVEIRRSAETQLPGIDPA